MFIATDTHRYVGKVVGSGQCMALVQLVDPGVPHSSKLRQGIKVRGADLPPGTVIATFNSEGRYDNKTDGSSHIAILLEQLDDGLRVVDQWVLHPVAERIIRFKAGAGPACDDGDRFCVVEAVVDHRQPKPVLGLTGPIRLHLDGSFEAGNGLPIVLISVLTQARQMQE